MAVEYPLVSVIIPVYNTNHTHLEECFNSIKNQTYRNVEVIIVDDGSEDNTAEFIDDYARSASSWSVVHTKNRGVSNARNIGIQNATGEYIQFIDSDDYIEEETIATCLKVAMEQNSDLILFSLAYYDDTLTVIDYAQDYSHLSTKKMPFSMKDLNSSGKFILEQLHPQPVTKMIKKDLLVKNKIIFPLKVHIAEDHVFSFLLYLNAKRISFIDKPLYKYRISSNSSMGTAYRYPTDIIKSFDIIRGLLDEKNMLTQWADSFTDFIISNIEYNQGRFDERYNAIKKLYIAASQLLDRVGTGILTEKMASGDKTVLGLLIARRDIELFEDYSRSTFEGLKRKSELEDKIRILKEQNRNMINDSEEVPGIKQSTKNLLRALGHRTKKEISRWAH